MIRDGLILGLAIRDEQLHGVWMTGGKRVHMDAVQLGYRSIPESLTELMGKNRESADTVVFTVPFHRLFMRSIDLPPAPDLPVGPFAEQFARSELPYPLEEAVADYSIMEFAARPGERRLLFTAGQKKDFEIYRAALETISIKDRLAIPQTVALYKAADMPSNIPNSLMVYFWKSHFDLLWCSYGQPRHLRLVPMARDRILSGVTSRDPDLLAQLSSELRISGDFIRKQSSVELRSIVARIVSMDRRYEELPTLLQPDISFTLEGRLLEGTEGAVVAEGACKVAQTGSPDLDFFRPKKSRPQDSRLQTPEARKQKLLVGALACVLFILLTAIVKTVVSYTWVKNAEASHAEIASASDDGLPEGAPSQLFAFLTGPDAIDALNRLAAAVPPETNLQDVSIDASEITIRGTAPRAMGVYEGLNTRGFQDVRLLQDVVAAEEKDMELFAIGVKNPLAAAGEAE